jgi:ketosteroid isomerase-like protein
VAEDGSGSAGLVSELEATEVAFAKTMADRDHAAFASFLAEETVFFGMQGEMRGKDAVAAAWEPLYQGPTSPFSWQPDSVTVLDSGNFGFTSGPIFTPDGKRVGTFNSTWRRGADGRWKVIFDRGCPPCDCPPVAEATE